MTKSEVMPDVDWKKMRSATSIRLNMKDGRELLLEAFDYWYGNDDTADTIDGAVYDVKDGSKEFVGSSVTYLPNPGIKRIEIIETQEKENHGPHPEVAYEQKSIEEMYK
jgi:hypothetical protein